MAKILIYHPWIYLKGGAEKLIIEYKKRSRHEVLIATSFFSKENTFVEFNDIDVLRLNCSNVNVKRNFLNIFKSFMAIALTDLKEFKKYDLVLISSEGLGDFLGVLRKKNGIKFAAYVHTPLKIIYDRYTSCRLYKRIGFRNYIIYKILKPVYMLINCIVWRRYDFVVANSMEVKNRILSGFLADKKKIYIVNPGVSKEGLVTNGFYKHKKYFFVPGRIMWQKNIEIAIHAFIEANVDDFELIVAGYVDEKSKDYFLYLKEISQNNSKVHLYPCPSDMEYLNFFNNCYSVIFTAPCEDWGIVPIEAMQKGKPVIAGNRGGPKESIINNVTGLLVEYNIKSFKNAIKKMALIEETEYLNMSNAGVDRSASYTWDIFAEKLDDLIDCHIIDS